MKRGCLLSFFIFSAVLFFIPKSVTGQSVTNISLALELNSVEEKDKKGVVSPTLIIKNTGPTEVKIAHPGNRMAIVFVVLNSLGNVVSPEGLAKIDPPFRELTIKPNSEVKESLPNLNFITGSALFGYELKPGETYRIIAIYRPNGEKNPGISSPERMITVR